MRVVVAALFLSLELAQAGFAQAHDAQPGQLDLTLIATPTPTQFRVELHNPGTDDLVLTH